MGRKASITLDDARQGIAAESPKRVGLWAAGLAANSPAPTQEGCRQKNDLSKKV